MPTYRPTTPDALVDLCVEVITRRPGVVVAGVDGADAARPTDLAERVTAALRATGRAAAVVALGDYVRPASVRKEFGHTDTESYRTMWFDYAALDREVITAVHRSGSWLPRLWDEATDRSPRDRPTTATDDQVLIIAGPMLLGRGLALSPTVRLEMSAAALGRRTPDADRWTVDALVEHTADVGDLADISVRYDHPDRPAVGGIV
ncbi:hypothetical protein ASG12_09945 [Williamsia sp. Leaf354]|uniref:hypothetical protein n=1 Tax=Williamsia sp. Leaf354 TaxID=1736349 RepID=UPI0006FD94BD|nr:hypothetical protein [Williamsia sp. Leaf354]KQR98706.1 hypothetical protein ASG12_09945 [Williamsia sp. Leaf354]